MSARCRGLTFVEVLACLLVLTLGFLSAVGVARYAVSVTKEAVASNIALPTARSVLCDARQSGAAVKDWSKASATAWNGYVNGMYVQRRVLQSEVIGGMTFATVGVTVFWNAESGGQVLELRERMAFNAP